VTEPQSVDPVQNLDKISDKNNDVFKRRKALIACLHRKNFVNFIANLFVESEILEFAEKNGQKFININRPIFSINIIRDQKLAKRIGEYELSLFNTPLKNEGKNQKIMEIWLNAVRLLIREEVLDKAFDRISERLKEFDKDPTIKEDGNEIFTKIPPKDARDHFVVSMISSTRSRYPGDAFFEFEILL
jgi:hypothetical protein